MLKDQSNQLPYLKSLTNCLNKIRTGGYTESFKRVAKGLRAQHSQQVYPPGAYRIINTFQIEGLSRPGQNAVISIIETIDGLKGTLVNAPVLHLKK